MASAICAICVFIIDSLFSPSNGQIFEVKNCFDMFKRCTICFLEKILWWLQYHRGPVVSFFFGLFKIGSCSKNSINYPVFCLFMLHWIVNCKNHHSEVYHVTKKKTSVGRSFHSPTSESVQRDLSAVRYRPLWNFFDRPAPESVLWADRRSLSAVRFRPLKKY